MIDLLRRILSELSSNPLERPPLAPGNCLPRAVTQALRSPDRLSLLSLHPSARTASPPLLQSWGILGQVLITDRAEQDRVTREVVRGIQESDGSQALCFLPRHGLHVEKGSERYDLIICYECWSLLVYHNDQQLGDALATTHSPEAALSELLRQAQIPIAPAGP